MSLQGQASSNLPILRGIPDRSLTIFNIYAYPALILIELRNLVDYAIVVEFKFESLGTRKILISCTSDERAPEQIAKMASVHRTLSEG
jgi:hypothetical protein